MTLPNHSRITKPQYRALALLRNNRSIGGYVYDRTINSLRRRGLLNQYSLEVTERGHAVMDTYGDSSDSV